MEILDLLEPHKIYTKTLKAEHKKNDEEYFDNLVNISEVNVDENKNTIKELNVAIKNRDIALQREKSLAGLRIFLIVLIVLFFVGCIVLGALYFSETITEIWALLVAIGLLVGGVLLIVLICTNINKELAHRIEIRKTLDKEVERIRAIAYG